MAGGRFFCLSMRGVIEGSIGLPARNGGLLDHSLIRDHSTAGLTYVIGRKSQLNNFWVTPG